MTINCKGKLLSLHQPVVMGIININADSFYEGSRADSVDEAVSRAETMLKHGAAIIDVGTMSSRPGAPLLDAAAEWQVLKEVVAELSKLEKIILSVDTVWSSTAQSAVEQGAHMINDISAAGIDSKMMEVVGAMQSVPYIMMHMRGIPETMQQLTDYQNLEMDLLSYFGSKIRMAREAGITDIILDPGFGFAKTREQSLYLLKNLELFRIYDLPLLVGLSRKSMLYKTLGIHQNEALNATTVANTMALMKGAKILRVHDVSEAVEACALYNAVTNAFKGK